MFDRSKREAAFIKNVTKQQLIDFANGLLSAEMGTPRRLLVSQVSTRKGKKGDKKALKTYGNNYSEIVDTGKYLQGLETI